MTLAPDGVAPIGREPVLAVLHSSVTAVVTGRSGSGLTCVLSAAAARLAAGGHCVVAGTASPGPSALPLSYLAGLRIPGPDGASHHLRWPVTPWRPEPGGDPVPLPDLPWFVELTAQEIRRAAGGRPVALLLDDLDLADTLSLSVLPLLRRRLRARLIGAGHAPAPGVVPRTAFAALIDRLPGPSRIHLEGLPDEHCLEVARLRDPSATPALVRALRPALGSWGCLPGLVLGVLEVKLAGGARAGRPLRLPEDHPLVHRLHGHGTAATLVAAAGSSGGLRHADLQVLASALGADHDHLAETVDLLTADGLLDHDGGVWSCSVPALAAALAPRALPPAALIALTVRALADERNRPKAAEVPEPAGEHTGRDGHREETAHRVTELAWRTDGHPAMLDLLLDTALARRSRAQAPGAPVPLLRPDLHTRLLAAIATATERAGPTGPAAALATGLADAALLAALSGRQHSALRIAAAGIRLLRRYPQAPGTRRGLDLLRTVAATLPPPVAGRPDPRPRRRPDRSGHGVAPVTVPGRPPDTAAAELTPRPALDRARRTLTAASGAGADGWAAAWQEWDRNRDPGTGAADAGSLRGLAGWGSRRELFAALHGQDPDGPVTAYLRGDWDQVAWAGREFLARTAPGPAELPEQDPVEPDELAGAALALLVALHRRDRNGSAALARRLSDTGRRGRPPVVGYALAAAAWRQRPAPGTTLRRMRQDLHRDLRRDLHQARREGPRNGLDLLLYAAYRLAGALGHTAAPPRLAGELDDLAGELRTARALLLAARAGAQLHQRPGRADVTDRLRLALTLPDAPLGLGTLGRAQALVLLAEQAPAPSTEVTALAGEAAKLVAPLGARDWLARARNLQPAGNAPASPGTRSLATAEQIRSLIGEGLTNRQISARLNLSEKSVEGYVTRLLRTHRCANRAELAARRTAPSPLLRPEPRPA